MPATSIKEYFLLKDGKYIVYGYVKYDSAALIRITEDEFEILAPRLTTYTPSTYGYIKQFVHREILDALFSFEKSIIISGNAKEKVYDLMVNGNLIFQPGRSTAGSILLANSYPQKIIDDIKKYNEVMYGMSAASIAINSNLDSYIFRRPLYFDPSKLLLETIAASASIYSRHGLIKAHMFSTEDSCFLEKVEVFGQVTAELDIEEYNERIKLRPSYNYRKIPSIDTTTMKTVWTNPYNNKQTIKLDGCVLYILFSPSEQRWRRKRMLYNSFPTAFIVLPNTELFSFTAYDNLIENTRQHLVLQHFIPHLGYVRPPELLFTRDKGYYRPITIDYTTVYSADFDIHKLVKPYFIQVPQQFNISTRVYMTEKTARTLARRSSKNTGDFFKTQFIEIW